MQFLKSKADLEYIEKRLKLDFINVTAENGCHTEMVNEQATPFISHGIFKQVRTRGKPWKFATTFDIQIKWRMGLPFFHQIAHPYLLAN